MSICTVRVHNGTDPTKQVVIIWIDGTYFYQGNKHTKFGGPAGVEVDDDSEDYASDDDFVTSFTVDCTVQSLGSAGPTRVISVTQAGDPPPMWSPPPWVCTIK